MTEQVELTVRCDSDADREAVRERIIEIFEDEGVEYECPSRQPVRKAEAGLFLLFLLKVGGGVASGMIIEKIRDNEDVEDVEVEGDNISIEADEIGEVHIHHHQSEDDGGEEE